jgi:hypothetical protein
VTLDKAKISREAGVLPGAAAPVGTGGLNCIKGHHLFREDCQHKLFFSRLGAPCIRPNCKGQASTSPHKGKKSGAFQKNEKSFIEEPRITRMSRTIFDERHIDVRIAYDGMNVKRVRIDLTASVSNIRAKGCSRRPVGDALNERYAHRASHSEAATGLSNTVAACNCRGQNCLRH